MSLLSSRACLPSAIVANLLSDQSIPRRQIGQPPRRRQLAGTNTCRHAHSLIRRATYGQPRYLLDVGLDPAYPIQVSHGVLRQPATPPGHPMLDRPRRNTGDGGDLELRQGRQLVVIDLQCAGVAVPTDRGPDDRDVTGEVLPFL